ncbi:MAG: toprim domain-containing protein [Rhodospirillales bacterium]|nr:toprim domain-containing protein [Rhodospirillales bacterium]
MIIGTARVEQADIDEARSRLADIVARSIVLTKQNGLLVAICPFHSEKTGSFTVYPDQHYHCFGCGAHGDAINFVQLTRNLDFQEAVAAIIGDTLHRVAGDRRRSPAHIPAEEAISPDPAALKIWEEGELVEGTLAERYLRARAIFPPYPKSLRFHPRLRYFDGTDNASLILPGLVAAIQEPERRIVAVHRIFIDPRGDRKAQVGKPKKTLGRFRDGAVRLASATNVLGLAEGVEDALSAMALAGIPCWAAAGAGRLHSIKLPDNVHDVHVFGDNDEAGRQAAGRAARAHTALGRRVVLRFPPDGIKDWNQWLVAGAPEVVT